MRLCRSETSNNYSINTMKKTIASGIITLSLLLIAGQAVKGQSPYFKAVTNLNPVGYWPLNETNPPPPPFAFSIVATNSGSLGAAGNGYYAAWYQPSGNTWYLTNNAAPTNGFTSDGDSALYCPSQGGQYVIVPRAQKGVVNTNLALTPPFTIEAWVAPATVTSGQNRIIIAQGGGNIDYGGPDPLDPFYGGPAVNGYAGFYLAQYQSFVAYDCFMTNGQSKQAEIQSPHQGLVPAATNSGGIGLQVWNHIVCTYDGTTEVMWVNDYMANSQTHAVNGAGLTFVSEPASPLMIGNAVLSGTGSSYFGAIDEVAIYNSVLPQSRIDSHYMAGVSGASGSYPSVVQADNPILYYRLDTPVVATNAGYPFTNWPVATNYGSLGASANGVYQPGTAPGAAGPPYTGFGSSAAVALNGWFGAVDVGGGNIPSALNPVGTVPLTVASWFRCNPADTPTRLQDIVGHGSNSYRLYFNNDAGETQFNPGSAGGPDVGFIDVYDMITNQAALNDGKWHMVAGVTDGTNGQLYLDGLLYKTSSGGGGINIVGDTVDLLLGGDPQYTFASQNAYNTDRTFDGRLAHVAIWTNALTSTQIQSLFNAAGVPPTMFVQPVGPIIVNQGTSVTVTTTVHGSAPISYQWYKNSTAVGGQTNENLSYPSILTNAIGNYYLVATSSYGSVTSSVVSVFVYGSPTVVAQTETDVEVYAGSSPDFAISVTGASPITYQWRSNGVNIAAATNSSYTVVGASASAAYTCMLTNPVGNAVAGPFQVTVLPDPTAPYPVKILSDRPIAFWRLDESSGSTAYDHVGGYNGVYTNVLLAYNAPYDPNTDPTEGNAPGFGTSLLENNSYVGWVPTNVNFSTPTNANGEFSIECWAQGLGVYNAHATIVSVGWDTGGTAYALDTAGGSGSAYYYRFFVRNAVGALSVATTAFSPYDDEAWHHVTAVCDEAGGNLSVYLDGTNAGSTAILPGSGVLASSKSLSIGSRQEGQDSAYDDQFDGSIDEVAVYNYALTAAQVQSHYYASGIAPAIQLLAANITVNSGLAASFPVTATGTPALYYLWYDPNNHLISTSTNATFVISNVQPSGQGTYTVVVSNIYGTATQSTTLTVASGKPQLAQDIAPLNVTDPLYDGRDTVSYTVLVSGSAPFSYQWYQNAAQIAGATNATYAFKALAGTNTYYVTVTNAYTASQNGGVPLQSSAATVIGVPVPQLNPGNYEHSMKISFPGYLGTPLTNFPALIKLSTSIVPGLAYSQFPGNGSDLRFTDAGGTAMLPYEIDEWNPGGVSTVWVNIPLLNGTNIWAYWDNPVSTDVAPAASNVWLNAGYEVVYHLKETNLPYADSAGQYPAANGAAPAQAPGLVGHGALFNNNNYISPGPVPLTTQFTAYAWIYVNPNAFSQKVIWANKLAPLSEAGDSGFAWYINDWISSDKVNAFQSDDDAGANTQNTVGTISFGQWHFMVSTWDASAETVTSYVDGVQVGSQGIVSDFSLVNPLYLGAFTDTQYGFQGSMDEARIQNGLASPSWILSSYANMSGSSFVGYSSVSTNTAVGPPSLVQDISPLQSEYWLYGGPQDTVSYTFLVTGAGPFAYQWYQNGAKIAGATNSTYAFTALAGTNTYYVTVTNAYTASNNGGVPLQSSTATVIGLPVPHLNPGNYAYRAKIWFPGFTGQPLTNFPALIKLSPSTVPGLDYSQFVGNGSDLRFADDSGTTMLPYEIDEWNASGVSTIWVEIPVFNGANIWAYWGNPADTDVSPAASNVWLNAGYKVVYHLKESGLPYADSTGQHPATNGAAPAQAAGMVGHGALFNNNNYISPGPVQLNSPFTASAWIWVATNANSQKVIWANKLAPLAQAGDSGFAWYINDWVASDKVDAFQSDDAGGNFTQNSIGAISFGQWHFMVSTWDASGATVTAYVDGVPVGSQGVVSDFSLANPLYLGAFTDGQYGFQGYMDEARIQSGIATSNWIATSYLNMSGSSFVSYSSVNLRPVLSIASSVNGYVLYWPTTDGAFTLETATSLAPGAVWTAVTSPAAVISNGVWQQIVQPAAGSHFYRLQEQ